SHLAHRGYASHPSPTVGYSGPHGSAELRRLLFNAAMSAIKTTVWKPIYEAYRKQGWSTTASLVIIARKIARAAWSIHHYRTTFHPERITKGLT
ncbi:MAG: hypothetical protein KC587_19135, partial [Nitrospira sp.]|nr:hypothetical protein [Nitrospira sp.]